MMRKIFLAVLLFIAMASPALGEEVQKVMDLPTATVTTGKYLYIFGATTDEKTPVDSLVTAESDPVFSGSEAASLVTGDKAKIDGAVQSSEVGTGVNQIPRLDGTGKLPAVDGSQLINLPSGGVTDYNALTNKPTIPVLGSSAGMGVTWEQCSTVGYYTSGACTGAGGTWGASPRIAIGSADFPLGSDYKVGGQPLDVGDLADGGGLLNGGGSFATIQGVPADNAPLANSLAAKHTSTDDAGTLVVTQAVTNFTPSVSTLNAYMVALDVRLGELDADLSLAGYPTIAIDQASPLITTGATADLTGTYATSSGTVTGLEYTINGGAAVNITPLASPWAASISSAALTPNGSDTVAVKVTNSGGLTKTKSIVAQYQTPVASYSPASLDFGNVTTDTTSSSVVTLSNTGIGNLATGTLAISGAGAAKYSILSNTCDSQNLSGGASCTYSVQFAPGATPGGPYTAQVDGPLGSVQNLSGSGIAPPSPIASQTTVNSYTTSTSLYSGNLRLVGQSFTATRSATANTIKVWATGAVTANLTVRIGTTTDLSSTYLAQGTLAYSGAMAGEVSIPLSGGAALTSGQLYYIGLYADGNAGNAIVLKGSSATTYAGGQYFSTTASWPLINPSNAIDLYFSVVD